VPLPGKNGTVLRSVWRESRETFKAGTTPNVPVLLFLAGLSD